MPEPLQKLLAGIFTVVLAAIVVAGMVIGESSEQDRVRAIGSRIRCPVCQGETIADSSVTDAADMLAIVEQKVEAGESSDAIFEFFAERYGPGILLDPRFSGATIVLWLLPLAAAGAGAALILGRRRSRSGPAAETGP